MRRTNHERTEAMRHALMAAARELFVEKGYAATATPEIVEAAGVTRGALYHHFEDKKALFAAVLAEEARLVAAAIQAAADSGKAPGNGAGHTREALLSGARAYFDAMAASGRTRLLLLDGPAVLGGESTRRLDADYAQASLKEGLAAHLEANGRPTLLLDAFTALLSAAFDRAALEIAAGGRRDDYEAAIAALIDAAAVK